MSKLKTRPPFPVGTVVRYIGETKSGHIKDGVTYWLATGLVCKVVENYPASPGLGALPNGAYDHGDDAVSVVEWPFDLDPPYRTLILHDRKHLWEVVR